MGEKVPFLEWKVLLGSKVRRIGYEWSWTLADRDAVWLGGWLWFKLSPLWASQFHWLWMGTKPKYFKNVSKKYLFPNERYFFGQMLDMCKKVPFIRKKVLFLHVFNKFGFDAPSWHQTLPWWREGGVLRGCQYLNALASALGATSSRRAAGGSIGYGNNSAITSLYRFPKFNTTFSADSQSINQKQTQRAEPDTLNPKPKTLQP